MLPTWYQTLPTPIIQGFSAKYKLDPYLIAAIIMKESGGVTWRTRMEPQLYQTGKYLYFYRENASRMGISEETEKVLQCMSFGLMQIMGSVARERGFDDHLPKLCADINLGIEYGCKHLRWLWDHYCSNESDAISSYNQGSPRKEPSGFYKNQKYVDGVYQFLLQLRKIG